MKVVCVIPARYQSTRFPGKPLADIGGRPMIWWVYHQVKKCNQFYRVVIATDDERIGDVCVELGLDYMMTSSKHVTSTERVYEIACMIPADVYVCVNGDEPLIDPLVIEKIIPTHLDGFFAANLMTEMTDPVEVIDNTNIKVVTDFRDNALFMSRSPIPYPKSSMSYQFYKHLGVLAYTKQALKFFSETPKGENERIEDINELRFIEHNKPLHMVSVRANTLSVDTPKDLTKVKEIIEQRMINGEISL